jgi:predicted RNase H-like HicB family nuclease
MIERTYTVFFEQDPATSRYIASIPALRCVTEGDTLPNARRMAKEAIELEVQALKEKGLPIPEETTLPPQPLVERIAVGVP